MHYSGTACFLSVNISTFHFQGEDVIALIPWDDWWEFELREDDSNPHIALLPLRADLRAKFNETAAWEYATSMDGEPYGYHNLIFSWIDTIDKNYPQPLDAHLVMTLHSGISDSKKICILLAFEVQYSFILFSLHLCPS